MKNRRLKTMSIVFLGILIGVPSISTITRANQPPSEPQLGYFIHNGFQYQLSIVSTDADGDAVSYKIDWGDGNISDWLGPFPEGNKRYMYHVWDEDGNYSVRAKAKDEHNAESTWSTPILIEYQRCAYIFPPWMVNRFISIKPKFMLKNVGYADATNLTCEFFFNSFYPGVIIEKKIENRSIDLVAEGNSTVITVDDTLFGLGFATLTMGVLYHNGHQQNFIYGQGLFLLIGPIIINIFFWFPDPA